MIFYEYECDLIDKTYEICEKYQFEELDEDRNYIKIEFTGNCQYYTWDDFNTKFEYYRTTEKICEQQIEPYFKKCWKELEKLNIFEKYEWDYDDYTCWYLYFNNNFINTLKVYDVIKENRYKITNIDYSEYENVICVEFVIWGDEGLINKICNKLDSYDNIEPEGSWNDEDGSYDINVRINKI